MMMTSHQQLQQQENFMLARPDVGEAKKKAEE
jgi:hypothetical protein